MGSAKLGVHYVIDHHSRLELAMIEELPNHVRNILHQDVILLTDSISENAFTDANMIANQLTLILRKYQFNPQEIDFTITSKEIFVQTIVLPTMKEHDLEKSIHFELSTIFPHFQDSYAYSKKQIIQNGSTTCYVTFCPNTILKSCYAMAVALSLPLQSITCSGNSLVKMGQLDMQPNKESNQIFLYLGSRTILFSVCAHGEWIASDYLDEGVEALHQKIAHLRENQSDTITDEVLFPLLQSELPQFSQVLITLATRYLGGMEHGQIFLYGKKEESDIFTRFIEQELALPCQIVSIPLDAEKHDAFIAAAATILLKKKGDSLLTLQNKKKLSPILEKIRTILLK